MLFSCPVLLTFFQALRKTTSLTQPKTDSLSALSQFSLHRFWPFSCWFTEVSFCRLTRPAVIAPNICWFCLVLINSVRLNRALVCLDLASKYGWNVLSQFSWVSHDARLIQDYFIQVISSEKLQRGWTLTTLQYTITHTVYFTQQLLKIPNWSYITKQLTRVVTVQLRTHWHTHTHTHTDTDTHTNTQGIAAWCCFYK